MSCWKKLLQIRYGQDNSDKLKKKILKKLQNTEGFYTSFILCIS